MPITLTELRKSRNPSRAFKKQARTQIYTLIYGPAPENGVDKRGAPIRHHDNGRPMDNPHRRRPEGWEFATAREQIRHLWTVAQWPLCHQRELLADFNRLAQGAKKLYIEGVNTADETDLSDRLPMPGVSAYLRGPHDAEYNQ